MYASKFAGKGRNGRFFGLAAMLVMLALPCFGPAPAAAQSSGSLSFLTHGEREWLAEHPVIRLAPDPSFPPIEFFDPDGAFKGIAAEYVGLIEAKLGIRFKITKTRNWAENVELTKSRGNDIWSAVSRTPSRLKYMHFTKPYMESPAVIVVRNDVTGALDTNYLRGKTVAVVAEYGIHEYLAGNYPDITLDTVPDVLTGLRMVSFGIADAMAVNMALASHVIEKSAITNLRVAGNTEFIYRWAFAARSDWPVLSHILEKTLAQIDIQERSAISRKWIAFEQPSWRPNSIQVVSALMVLTLLVVVGVLLWVRVLNRLVQRRTEEANAARDLSAAAEASLRLAIETMSEGFVFYDADERLVICNTRFRELYGYSEEQAAPGAWAHDLFALDRVRGAVVITEHADHEFEHRRRITRRDGEGMFEVQLKDGRWLQIRESVTADGGVVSIQADITAERAAAEELLDARDFSAAAEARLRLAIESMSEGFVHYDAEDCLVNCNTHFRDLYGYSEEEAVPGARAEELSLLDKKRGLVASSEHPDGNYVGRRSQLKQQGSGTFQLNLADGRWLQIRESVTSDGGVVSIQADITERKRAEAELAEKSAILENTLNAMDQGIAMYDGDFNLLAWNRAFSELRDFPESELYRGKPLSEVARYQAEHGNYDGALEQLENEVDKQVKYWVDMAHTISGQQSGIQHRPDGSIQEVRANVLPQGGFLLTFTDVTIRQQAEEALKEREGRLREILEHSPIAISIIRDSGAGERVYSNQNYRDMLMGGENILLNDIGDSYVNPDDREQILGLMAEEGVLSGLEVERRRADGEKFWALMSSQQVEYEGAPADIVWVIDITGRKAAEAALRESEARYQSITDNIPGVVYQRVMHEDGSLSYPLVSSGMSDLYGIEAEEIMAEPMKIFSVLEPEEQKRLQESIVESAAALEPWNAEFAITTPDGQPKWIRGSSSVRRMAGNVTIWDGVLLDISERKQADEALRQSERRFAAMLQDSPLAVAVVRSADRRVIFANDRLYQMFGIDEHELQTIPPGRYFADPEGRQLVIDSLARDGFVRDAEVRLKRRSGEEFWATASFMEIDYVGEPSRLAWYYDITERKRAEQAVQQSEARLLQAQRLALMGDWEADLQTGEQIWSEPLYDILGTPSTTPASYEAFVDAVHPDDRDRVAAKQDEAFEKGEAFAQEYRVLHPDGTVRVILTRNELEHDSDGLAVRAIGTAQDITERKHAEEELAEKEAQLRVALENMPGGIRYVDGDKNYVFFNSRYNELYGFPEDLLKVGESNRVENLFQAKRGDFGPGDPDILTDEWLGSLPVDTEPTSWERTTVEGKTLHVNTAPTPAGGIVNIVTDISERKQAEVELANRTALIQLLQRTAAEANEATGLADAMQGALSNICAHTGWPVGHAYVIDPKQADLLITSGIWHLDDAERFAAFRKLTTETTFGPGEGLPGRVLAKGRPAWITDVNKDTGFLRASSAEDIGISGGFACPVLVGPKVVAVLEFYAAEATEPDPSLLDALVHVGLQLGQVHERERSEMAMRESEAELRDILETSPISVSIAGPDGKLRYANSSAVEARQISEEEAQDTTASDHFFDDVERDRVLKLLQDTGRVRDEEVRLKRGSDSYFWTILSLNPISYQREKSLVSWFIDITERKRGEADLAEKEAQLRSALDNMSGGLYMVDKDLNLQIFNDDFQTLYEIPDGVIRKGAPIRDVVAIRAARGDYGSGDPEELVASRLAGFFKPETEFLEDRVPSGRIIENMRAPTDDGGLVSVFSDITDRKQAEEELVRQTNLLNNVLQSASQGIVAYDGERRLVAYNQHFKEIWKFPDDLLQIGSSALEMGTTVISHRDKGRSDAEAAAQAWIDALASGEASTGEARGLDGQQYEVLSRRTSDNGFVVSFSDVTERINAAQELERARDQAEAATRSKSAFLASMSHEIRTPMNGVVGMIELLTQTRLDTEQRDMSDTIRKSAFALLQIIDDILDFSKIEAGQLNLERIPCSISDVVETVADILGPGAKEKGLATVVFVDPTIPEPMLGDPVRLRQILFNLVGNAIKFTDTGQVTIRAERVAASKTRPEALRFKVIDTGIGVPSDAVDGLFEAFTQAETSTTRRFGGTGLGLSICTLLIELMDGSIAVKSEPEKGSTFTVTLPLERSPSEVAGAAPAEQSLAGLRVLVAAGNDDVRTILKHYLKHWRAEVNTTSDIDRVVSLARKAARESRRFDVIILGALWSNEKKAKICDAIRSEAKLAGTRFVLTTFERRSSTELDQKDSVEVSVHPMRRATFLTAVAIAAGRQSPEVPHAEELSEIEDLPVPTIEEARSQGNLILVAEDHPTNQVVILRQLNRLGLAAEIAEDGRQALAMLQGGNHALLLTDCHMPEMDGFELTAAIREAEASNEDKIPIVAITANALQGEAERCLEAGMDDYLAKPVELMQLSRVLHKWLPAVDPSPGPSPSLSSGPPPASPAPTDRQDPIDMAALGRLLGSDDAAYLGEMLAFFWETVADTPDQLAELIHARDAAGLQEAAHAAKGAARSAAAQTLAATLQDLESAAATGDWSTVAQTATTIDHEFSAVEVYINKIVSKRN